MAPRGRRYDEDRCHLHRELMSAKRDRTRVTNRMKGLLANHGLTVDLTRDVVGHLAALRQWVGRVLPSSLQARLTREWARVEFYTGLIGQLEGERHAQLRAVTDPVLAEGLPTESPQRHRRQQRLVVM